MDYSRLINPALFAIALLTFNSRIAKSQDQTIDSLESLLETAQDVDRPQLLSELARTYLDVDNEVGFDYAKAAHESAKVSGDTLTIVMTARLKAQGYRRLGKIDSAIVLFDKMLPIAKRHNFHMEMKKILNSTGVAYLGIAKYDKALVCFLDLLRLPDLDNDDYWKGTVLSNIGMVYENLGDYETALAYHHQALDLRSKIHDQEGMQVSYINISGCLALTGRPSEAMEFVLRAYANCGNACSDDMSQSLFHNLGIISFMEHNYKESENYFIRSYELNKKINDPGIALANLAYLVKINAKFYRKGNAEKYLYEINELISDGASYNHQIIQAYLEVIALYERSNDFQKLAEYQKKYITLKDSIFDQRFTTNLMKIEAEYLEKENRAKIDSQAKILALNKEIIVRQKYLNSVIGIVAFLLIILTMVLFKSNRQKQKMNQLLDTLVQERTLEIESSCSALHRANEERDLLLEKTSVDIHVSLATVKGLCCTGLKDVDDPLAIQYFNRMNTAIENFSHILNRLQNKRNDIRVTL